MTTGQTAPEMAKGKAEHGPHHGHPTGLGHFSYTSWEDMRAGYQEAFEREHAGTGRRWEEAEPGYRYGHEKAGEGRFQGYTWEEIEVHLEAGYPEWAQQQGYEHHAGAWERIKTHARDAWHRVHRGGAGSE